MSPLWYPRRTRALLVLGVLLAIVAVWLRPFGVGLATAPVLAVLLAGPARRLRPVLGGTAAAGVVCLGFAIAVVLPIMAIAQVISSEAPHVLPGILADLNDVRLHGLIVMGIPVGQIVAQHGVSILGSIGGKITPIVSAMSAGVLHLGLGTFGCFFLLRDGERLWDGVAHALPFEPHAIQALRSRFTKTTRATTLSLALVAIIQGLLVGVAFAWTHRPAPILFGVLGAVTSVLPVVGSSVIWGPAVVVALTRGDIMTVVILIALCCVTAILVDNVLRPVIARSHADVHPFISVVGGLAGIHAVGLIGLVLGPLLITYVGDVWRIVLEDDEMGGPLVRTNEAERTMTAP